MARIKTGAIITDIRGKIKGSVFQSGQGGLIMRNNPNPVNKRSNPQNAIRVVIGTLHNQWKGLGNGTRAQWDAFAQFTGTKQINDSNRILSGQQLFIKINSIRQLYGVGNLSNPVFSRFSLTPVTLQVQSTFGTLNIRSSRALVAADEFLSVKLSTVVLDTVNNSSGRFKQIIFTSVDGIVQNITTQYTEIFGAIPSTGDSIFIEYLLHEKSNGLVQPIQSQRVTVI